MEFATRVTHHPPPSIPRRMFDSMWRQSARSAICPSEPRLDGQVGLVTGGSRGIGLAISRGLALRGAEVIAASRGEDRGLRVAAELSTADRPAHFVSLDLGDLARIPDTLDRLESILVGRRLEILIANAGLWPSRYAQSAQGHEIAFGTNVLGHHALIRGALSRDLLAPGARVVVLTGDIYIMVDSCSADFRYRGAYGGQLAYCRSKLGNLWYARELARRHPELRVHAAHPGVIASDLGVGSSPMAAWIKNVLMLPIERGAQTPLFCATQPGLESGAYYHNTLGRVDLAPSDPAADDEKSAALWALVERLA